MIALKSRWILPGLLWLAFSATHAVAGPDEWQKHMNSATPLHYAAGDGQKTERAGGRKMLWHEASCRSAMSELFDSRLSPFRFSGVTARPFGAVVRGTAGYRVSARDCRSRSAPRRSLGCSGKSGRRHR